MTMYRGEGFNQGLADLHSSVQTMRHYTGRPETGWSREVGQQYVRGRDAKEDLPSGPGFQGSLS